MFMCFENQTSVINLDLTWKQSFLIFVIRINFKWSTKEELHFGIIHSCLQILDLEESV
jgi:hypothetical protein